MATAIEKGLVIGFVSVILIGAIALIGKPKPASTASDVTAPADPPPATLVDGVRVDADSGIAPGRYLAYFPRDDRRCKVFITKDADSPPELVPVLIDGQPDCS